MDNKGDETIASTPAKSCLADSLKEVYAQKMVVEIVLTRRFYFVL